MCLNKKRKCYHFYLKAASRKSQKLIPSKKSQSFLIAKVPAKHKKIANPQN